MNIAICEDDKKDLEILLKFLNTYCTRNNTGCNIKTFSCAEDLLLSNSFNTFHVIFLDIYMRQISGMKAATMIQEQGYHGHFVFTTSSTDFVLESFLVNVSDYLVKPYDYERFSITMNKLYELNRSNLISINVLIDKTEIPIYLKDIYCIETGTDHNTLIHRKEDTLMSKTLIREIEKELLPYDNFIRCHRSFIINMNYVEYIRGTEIFMKNGKTALLTIRNTTMMKKKIAHFISTRS